MKHIILTIVLIVFTSIITLAQDYKTGIGVRVGTSNGITVKQFITDGSALELIASTRWGGIHITGLYDFHTLLFDVQGLYWVYGLGVHVGFTDGDNNRFDDGENHTLFGADLSLGVEYKFEKAPISIGLDWRPYYDFIGDSQFVPDETAISVRFVF